jgi:hypothetical protein
MNLAVLIGRNTKSISLILNLLDADVAFTVSLGHRLTISDCAYQYDRLSEQLTEQVVSFVHEPAIE